MEFDFRLRFLLVLVYFWQVESTTGPTQGSLQANTAASCSSPIKWTRKSDVPLPDLSGERIYALVRLKSGQTETPEEREAREYADRALERLVRCKVNNTACFQIAPPRPRIEYGKFCWVSQRFKPLKAGISAQRCRVPARSSDIPASSYWQDLLTAKLNNTIELQIAVTNFFLQQGGMSIIAVANTLAPPTWSQLLGTDGIYNGPGGFDASIPLLMGSAAWPVGTGVDPLNPMHPLNPLNPYSSFNPYLGLPESHSMCPYNDASPMFPLNPGSPFSPYNSANAFNPLSPLLILPPWDPMSPWNPSSPYYPSASMSPYNSENPNSPFNGMYDLPLPPACSPFSPRNCHFLLAPDSPWHPFAPIPQLAWLPASHPMSPLNPASPFTPLLAWNPQNPLAGLDPGNSLHPLSNPSGNVVNGIVIMTGSASVPSPPYDPQPPPYAQQLQSMPYAQQSQPMPYAQQPQSPIVISDSSPPPMVPPGMYEERVRTIGRWFYRYREETPSIPVVNPCDPASPFFAGSPNSPYHPMHPSNPYSFLNPLNGLDPSDPKSPYNPQSPNFAGNLDSPYNPAHPMNPFNPKSPLRTCQQTGSLHHLNPRSPFYVLNPRSPFNPANPASPYSSANPLLAQGKLSPEHALNPTLSTSPFHPNNPGSPYSPANFRELNPAYALNALNAQYMAVTSSPASSSAPPDSPADPNSPNFNQLGWYGGVQEDAKLVYRPEPDRKAELLNQMVPYTAPSPSSDTCPPAPPAPPAPSPPYFPGYYMWDPTWPAPKFIQTSNVPSNQPIPPEQWKGIWNRLWELKCKRQALMASPQSPYGSEFAIMDVPASSTAPASPAQMQPFSPAAANQFLQNTQATQNYQNAAAVANISPK